MANRTEWPQSLKDFANRTFAACTDANRQAVSEELKAIIFKSFQDGTINTTDWNTVDLPSLHGKKKKNQVKKRSLLEANAPPTSSTAAALGKAAGIGADTSFEEQSRREKRARRFEQDELQRQAEEQQALRATFAAPPPVPLGAGGPGAGAGLAGRLGMPGAGAGFANGGIGGSRLDPGYQQSPAGLGRIGGGSGGVPPVPPLGGMGGGGWAAGGGSRFPIAGFGDADLVADANVIDWDKDTVVGTSTKLEKPYLRLTSAPDPRTVRPLAVLQQTLELLKQKWRAEQNYAYICDQFKSMRQDLTVQRIKNAFTVKVYEIHARIALEKGDLGEYNQCQSQLRMLYAYDLPGCVMEFLAYRILYLLHTRNRREVNSLMTELHEAHRQDEAVRHALEVRKALVNGNYHRFFLLYADAPNMNAYIMDHFIERERVRALLIMAKCYRPHCPLSLITSELAFADHAESDDFLRSIAADIYIRPGAPAPAAAPTAPASSSSNPTPAEAAAAAAGLGKGAKKKGKFHPIAAPPAPSPLPPLPPLEERKWDAKAALPALLAAATKHKRVDIKGQI